VEPQVKTEQKKRRRRSKPAMIHTAIVLPSEMIQLLKQSERGLSQEIRHRLTQSLVADEHDPRTRKLAGAVMELSRIIAEQAKHQWFDHPEVHAALMGAVHEYLVRYRPSIEGTPAEIPGFKPGHSTTLGKMIGANFVITEAARERQRQELVSLKARIALLERSAGKKSS
jgi:hypothetical protein